jgi:hypothetical protein
MNKSSEDIEGKVEEMVSIVDKLGSLLRGILGAKKEEIASESPESSGEEVQKKDSWEDDWEETPTETPVKAESVKSNGQAKASKSDLVRDFFGKHGTEVRNKDVVEAIKKESGIELTESLVSALRKKFSERGAKGKAHKEKEPKVWTNRVTSGSALIREYLEENGLDSPNDEVVNNLKKRGVEVRPTLVSSVRAILKKKGVKTTRIKRKVKAGRGPTMPSVVIEALKKAGKEGLELSEIAKKVLKSGYEYKGSKDIHGLTQNVYQALHNLSKKIAHPGFKGSVPVVLHEKTPGQRFGRYKLNPKAVKNKVA